MAMAEVTLFVGQIKKYEDETAHVLKVQFYIKKFLILVFLFKMFKEFGFDI